MLDGGRIATALSPWLWLVGLVVLGWMAWTHPNFIIWLVLIISLPRLFSLFRKRTEEEQRFYEIKPAQRWTMAAMYFGLLAALVFGMHVALAQLQERGIHPGTRTQVLLSLGRPHSLTAEPRFENPLPFCAVCLPDLDPGLVCAIALSPQRIGRVPKLLSVLVEISLNARDDLIALARTRRDDVAAGRQRAGRARD